MRTTFALGVVAATLYGCPTPCKTDFECGAESYCNAGLNVCTTDCFIDADCAHPLGCELTDDGCAPIGARCADGRCVGEPGASREVKIGLADDGFGASFGDGVIFVVEHLGIGDSDVGFDLDGACAPNCVDNILSPLAIHANTPLRQGVVTAHTRLLIEIAGLLPEYRGRDDAVTVKIYDASEDPNGGFVVHRSSLDETNQARIRARAKINNHRLVTDGAFDLALTLSLANNYRPTLQFDRAHLQMKIPAGLREFDEGVLGASLRASSLHAIENPYCRQGGPLCSAIFPDSTLLDMIALTISRRPDIDVDRDGNECFVDVDGDQTIDLCCDQIRRGATCPRTECEVSVEPITASPDSCALAAEMADGYSVGIALRGTAAQITRAGL